MKKSPPKIFDRVVGGQTRDRMDDFTLTLINELRMINNEYGCVISC